LNINNVEFHIDVDVEAETKLQQMMEHVIKRNGEKVKFVPSKLNKWAEWACSGLFGVSWSDIVMKAVKSGYDGMRTEELQRCLIDACISMVEVNTDYEKVASRLYLADLRKRVYGKYTPPNFIEFYNSMVTRGLWEDMGYTTNELTDISKHIDHDRDDKFPYSGLRQMGDKYLMRNKVTGELYETPQFLYMGLAMASFRGEPLIDLLDFYDRLSMHKVNVPTPPLVGCRTSDKGFASCCLISGGDTADSIEAAGHIVYQMVKNRSGIGIELETRGPNEPVKNGLVLHNGKMNYYRMIDALTKANTQECYDDQTDVLTKRGFVKFSELVDGDLVAQVHNDQTVDFVKPTKMFSYDYKGDMISFKKRGIDLLVTPNHRMVSRKVKYDDASQQTSLGYDECSAEFWNPKRTDCLDFGGSATGKLQTLSWMQQLQIAYQADGYKIKNKDSYSYIFGFKKLRKVERLIEILSNLDACYTTNVRPDGVTEIRILASDMNMKKSLSWVYDLDISSEWGEEFIEELRYWDGDLKKHGRGGIVYNTSDITCADVVQYVASLVPMKSSVGLYGGVYRVTCFTDVGYMTGESTRKSTMDYDGVVYCVEVPTNNLIVRRGGYTTVCGNSRGGSATMQFAFFDPEVTTLLKLRNPKTVDKSRIDTMDYSFAVNKYFWSQYVQDGQIALISPYYGPDTHKAFYGKDIHAFIEAYEREVKQWKDAKVIRLEDGSMVSPIKYIKAKELLEVFADQRSDTARIYMHNIDETNRRSTYKDPVRQSNLCLEIVEPTSPYSHITDLYSIDGKNPIFGNDVDGESALCNLGGVVVNRIENDADYERTTYLLVKFIDNIIEMQTYPFPHMEFTSKNRRNVGVGIINLAHAMAERGLSYASRAGRNYMHHEAERMSFFLHKASIRLAKEKGQCDWFHKTTYSDGVLPIDNFNKFVDEFVDGTLRYDWEALRIDMATYGMRNSVLEAYMPSESSSVTIGCTNGIEPARQHMIVKSSRQGDIPQIVPDFDKLQFDYELAFDIPAEEYLIAMAVLQKFTGQSISTNVYYDLNKFEDRMVPLSLIVRHLLLFTKLGGKTLYYHNSDVSIKKDECENCSI